MPHSHDMVHVEGKGVHGSLPPLRHMEGLSRQRQPSSSCKHLKEDGIKKVAEEGLGGSNTGFIRPFPGRRITLLWWHAFGFMDYEGKEPRSSRCKGHGCLPYRSTGFWLSRICAPLLSGSSIRTRVEEAC